VLKDLKQSTRQRFVAIAFDYPRPELERRIVMRESGLDEATAERLVRFAGMTRNLKGQGLDEGASTRLLVHAAKLIVSGLEPRVACRGAIAEALTDDPETLAAINELSASLF
jgi:nitric oxide reductase NorQ protein